MCVFVCLCVCVWCVRAVRALLTGENAIIVVSGANLLLRPQDVQSAGELISRSKVVVCQLEVSPETSLEALRLAKQHHG